MEVIENAVFALVGSDKRHTVSLSGVFVGEALRIGAGLPFAERLACAQTRGATKAGDSRSTGIPCRRGELLGEVVEHDLVKVTHRAENEVSKVGPQIVPQRPLADQLFPNGIK